MGEKKQVQPSLHRCSDLSFCVAWGKGVWVITVHNTCVSGLTESGKGRQAFARLWMKSIGCECEGQAATCYWNAVSRLNPGSEAKLELTIDPIRPLVTFPSPQHTSVNPNKLRAPTQTPAVCSLQSLIYCGTGSYINTRSSCKVLCHYSFTNITSASTVRGFPPPFGECSVV